MIELLRKYREIRGRYSDITTYIDPQVLNDVTDLLGLIEQLVANGCSQPVSTPEWRH